MRTLWKWLSAVAVVLVVAGCATLPYNKKAADTVEAYGEAADRHIVRVITAWKTCKEEGVAEAACRGAAFKDFEANFYDEWESRLFTAQQTAAAGDALGICEKAAGYAREFAAKAADAVIREKIRNIDFADGKSCSLGTIGGVLQQHRNLREFHERFIVIDRDDGKTWRETIAQSVRIALTVENFKKSAADAGVF